MSSEKNPVRVLHVLAGLWIGGGETLIMNLYRNIDRDKVQFDFLIRSDDELFKDEIENLGGKVYKTAGFPKHFYRNWVEVKQFLKEHKYDIIHVHANSLIYITPILLAAKENTNCIILHSHSTNAKYGIITPIHNFNKFLTKKKITNRFACSTMAGEWMFGSNFEIVKNGIDIDKFSFSQEKRDSIRKEYGISENTLVVGVAARLSEPKNLPFAIDIFREINKINDDSVFLIAGDGPLRGELEQSVRNYNLNNKVKFLGACSNIADLLNAFDVFLMPSLYEGLSFSLIEAQANGLCCFSSDNISEETIITPCLHCVSLTKSPAEWAEQILNEDKSRIITDNMIRDAGFDIRYEAERLEDFYLSKQM